MRSTLLILTTAVLFLVKSASVIASTETCIAVETELQLYSDQHETKTEYLISRISAEAQSFLSEKSIQLWKSWHTALSTTPEA